MERRIETERLTGAMTTWYYLHGEHGCVQFMLMYIAPIGTYLPLDVGVHSYTPLYEGQEAQSCATLKGKCYFSPNLRAATKVFEAFGETNDPETIWSELEHVYRTTF